MPCLPSTTRRQPSHHNVLFGPRVSIYTSNHAVDAEDRVAGGCYAP